MSKCQLSDGETSVASVANLAKKRKKTHNEGAVQSNALFNIQHNESVGEGAVELNVKPKKQRKRFKNVPKQQRVGNFRSYYSYRLGQKHQGELEDDPRLAALDISWFQNKRGLDVGCNSGELTIAVAKNLEPSYLLGVDIDAQLISRAREYLKDLLRQEHIEKAYKSISGSAKQEDELTKCVSIATSQGNETTKEKSNNITSTFADEMPMSFKLWKPPMQIIPRTIGKAVVGASFPLNVIFKREDIVVDSHAGKDYDFITFSVSKWIHLFHGDDGIKKVFGKIYNLLTPGGRLILEPQPWKSYHKRKFTSEITAANYSKIQLRPKDFPKYLIESVGFRSCDFLEVCQTSSKGFRRPVYLAQK
ncbi:hypothetical protein CCR75_003974 [Bremia lactucae]|uniref:RNA methyltransferase n=1 Tax=Bremia lactucae TaxID=4779 RepID=A0A976FPI0_BRELC|nr:hypothetical protein CCR75_003974 [Bremia lactucae]